MAVTYDPIYSTILTATATTITFSSIPQTYTDLIIVKNGTHSTGVNATLRFNSDSTVGNYGETYMYVSGSTPGSSRDSNQGAFFIDYSSNASSNVVSYIHIMNYTNTTTYKGMIYKWLDAGQGCIHGGGTWRKTPEAITQIDISGATFNVGSTFTLYGIKAA
jgi:hypothetical protein